MTIRRAKEKDIDSLLRLLSQVLELHATIRPDVFVPGSTKYTLQELSEKLPDDQAPVYVAVDENDNVIGYAFCVLREPPFANTMRYRKTFYIDDLCVDEAFRGKRIGETLFRFVLEEAKRLDCAEVTLNVWEGNDGAKSFYEKMGMRPKETMMEYDL